MSETSRAFPDQPSLGFLNPEAERRLADGEFTALHQAQLAIAREHGLASWTVLRQTVESLAGYAEAHALHRVQAVLARFRGAGTPGWTTPTEDELRGHFDERFLDAVPLAAVVNTLAEAADQLDRGLDADFTLVESTPQWLRARVDGLGIEAAVAAEPPHRLTGLRLFPVAG